MQPRFLAALLAGASLPSLCPAQLPQTMTISTDQPTYRLGQVANTLVEGTPGRYAVVGVSETPSPTTLSGVGSFCFDPLAPDTFLFGLGVLPPIGGIMICDPIPCTQAMIGRIFYIQGVEMELPTRTIVGISNCHTVDLVDGDCAGVCDGGVVVLGLQTEFLNVTNDTVQISLSAIGASATLVGTLNVSWDFNNPPALPIANANGSVILTKVERVGTTVTVRYEVDAAAAGFEKHFPITKFSAAIDADLHQELIDVSCAQPIDVGSLFGDFVITLLIDKN